MAEEPDQFIPEFCMAERAEMVTPMSHTEYRNAGKRLQEVAGQNAEAGEYPRSSDVVSSERCKDGQLIFTLLANKD